MTLMVTVMVLFKVGHLMRCDDIINHPAGIIVTIVLDDDQRKQ